MKKRNSEKGQAIILIVFSIVGLIGLTALTVDGGMAYSDRRNAQNAADNSALAAARANVRNISTWKTEALTLAATNGYPDTNAGSGTSNSRVNVEIYTCAETGNTCPAPYAGQSDFLQVMITSNVSTFFAPVIGVRTVTNKVYSIASADAGYKGSIINTSTIAGLKPSNNCHGNDQPPVTLGGSGNSNGQNGGQLVSVGGGVFSNSTSACSMVFQGNANATINDSCFGTAGSFQTIGNSTITNGCKHTNLEQQPAVPSYLPNPVCTGPAVKNGTSLSGGTVSGNFPPNGVNYLNSGIYCVDGDFVMTGGSLSGNGVTIVMNGGDIDITGGTINITAPTSGPFPNLLLYSPPPSANTPDAGRASMDVRGNPLLTFQGTTMLPGMQVKFSGSSRWCTISNNICTPTPSQIIAWTVEITGSAEIKMLYDPEELWVPDVPPTVNLAK